MASGALGQPAPGPRPDARWVRRPAPPAAGPPGRHTREGGERPGRGSGLPAAAPAAAAADPDATRDGDRQAGLRARVVAHGHVEPEVSARRALCAPAAPRRLRPPGMRQGGYRRAVTQGWWPSADSRGFGGPQSSWTAVSSAPTPTRAGETRTFDFSGTYIPLGLLN